jgi:hypothetical protein
MKTTFNSLDAIKAARVNLHAFPNGEEQWLIKCDSNGYCIGLTHRDGVTLNAELAEFYAEGDSPASSALPAPPTPESAKSAPAAVPAQFPALLLVHDGAEVVPVDILRDAGEEDWKRRNVYDASADAFTVSVVPLTDVLKVGAMREALETLMHVYSCLARQRGASREDLASDPSLLQAGNALKGGQSA